MRGWVFLAALALGTILFMGGLGQTVAKMERNIEAHLPW